MQDYLKFRYAMDDVFKLFVDGIVPVICETEAFQRLKGISFLGAVEKTPEYLKRRHNRFDHSVGVALLAQYYAQKMGFSASNRVKVVVAALLHDIGHAPLSHSIEPLFAERFNLNHHVATENILHGKAALGKNLYSALSKSGLEIDYLINLMAGEDTSELGRIFSSRINVDTIEAIWRGGTYIHKQFFHPKDVLDAFIAGEFNENSAVDTFWQEKNNFYALMIYSNDGIAADHWARARVRESDKELAPEDFYLTEKHFLAKYPGNEFQGCEATVVDVKVRRFEVDIDEVVSSYANLEKRYKIIKSKKSMLLKPPARKLDGPVQSSIFGSST